MIICRIGLHFSNSISRFRLVDCYFQELDRVLMGLRPYERNEKVVIQVLNSFPEELGKVYEQTLRRIPGEKKKDAINMLHWLACSERLLQIDELYQVIAPDADNTEKLSIRHESGSEKNFVFNEMKNQYCAPP